MTSPWASAPPTHHVTVTLVDESKAGSVQAVIDANPAARGLSTPDSVPPGMDPLHMLLAAFGPVFSHYDAGGAASNFLQNLANGPGEVGDLSGLYQTALHALLVGTSEQTWQSPSYEDWVLDQEVRVRSNHDWRGAWTEAFDALAKVLQTQGVSNIVVVTDFSLEMVDLKALVRRLHSIGISSNLVQYMIIARADQIAACPGVPTL